MSWSCCWLPISFSRWCRWWRAKPSLWTLNNSAQTMILTLSRWAWNTLKWPSWSQTIKGVILFKKASLNSFSLQWKENIKLTLILELRPAPSSTEKCSKWRLVLQQYFQIAITTIWSDITARGASTVQS